MSFGILAVVVLAGLGGPLLGASERRFVPVVVGEILAGILVGPAVLGVVDPHQPTISFLSEVGFAMLMLTVGMHLPLRDKRLARALRGGALLAALVGLLAVPAGLLAGAISGDGHAAIYAVVLASGSVAVLLPAIQESGLGGTEVLTVMAQVTIADVVTIISVPIVLQPSRTWHAVLGTALVAGAVFALRLAALPLRGRAWVEHVRRLSKERHWALDLRLSLLILFGLAWLAQKGGTSILIAGFGAGVTVALIGGPKRLSTQVRGMAEGFFVPLFFVVLGAQLDLSGLFGEPAMIGLAAGPGGAERPHPRARRPGDPQIGAGRARRHGPTRGARRGRLAGALPARDLARGRNRDRRLGASEPGRLHRRRGAARQTASDGCRGGRCARGGAGGRAPRAAAAALRPRCRRRARRASPCRAAHGPGARVARGARPAAR